MTALHGERNGRRVEADAARLPRGKGLCGKCGGPVKRSWVTGILHYNCRACRELIMMYGPNITVRRMAP